MEGCYLAIKLEKKYKLDIPQQDVWEAILDPDTLAEILPNCKSLDPIGAVSYTHLTLPTNREV